MNSHPLVAIAESECARMAAAQTGKPDLAMFVDLTQLVDQYGQPVRFTTRAEARVLDRTRRRAKRLLAVSRRASEVALASVACRG